MARFINIDYPVQHGGVNRVSNGLAVLGNLNVVHAVLHGLAALGTPLRSLAARWSAARTQRAADRKLWELALTDARIMADLSRAMSREASDIARYY
jgi:hypothetical protein